MELVKAYLKIYRDTAKRKRFLQKHFPQGKIDSNFIFADSDEKNNNLRQFLQDLIIHSGLLTTEQDFVLLPKRLSGEWYRTYGIFDWIKRKFKTQCNYNLLYFCWPEKMIEPNDSKQPHWHKYDFRTSKYPKKSKPSSELIQYVRHIYTTCHLRVVGINNQITLSGGYCIENLFDIAYGKGGFRNLLNELDLESIFTNMYKSVVSDFVGKFFSEIDVTQQQKISKSTTGRCFNFPFFRPHSQKTTKKIMGNKYYFSEETITSVIGVEKPNIGISLLTREYGGIYTSNRLRKIFLLGKRTDKECSISISPDKLIIPDSVLAQSILEAGKIALDRGYDLTQLSLEKLQSLVTGWYYREILRPPELIFNRPANLRELSKNEWEKMMVDLVIKAQNGDKASTSIVCEEYQKIVGNIARKYYCLGHTVWDLLQQGNIGLLEAIRDFDYTKISIFTPFARICIKRKIFVHINSAKSSKHKALNEALHLETPIGDGDDIFLDFIKSDQENDPLEELINNISDEPLDKLISKLSDILSEQEMQVLTQIITVDPKRKSFAKIANNLGLSLNEVYNSSDRIKEKVRKKLLPLFPHLATLIRS